MNFGKLNNEQIYLMVRNRILSSCYWRTRLFSTISGYKESELISVAKHTKRIRGYLEAKVEELRVSSFALPYLAKGRPILTNSKKERKVLISFYTFVVSENHTKQEESVEDVKKAVKNNAEQKVKSEEHKVSHKKTYTPKRKEKGAVSLTVEQMESLVKEWEEYERAASKPDYIERRSKAFGIMQEFISQDGKRKVSKIIEASEMVDGNDKLRILKKAVKLMNGEDKESVTAKIAAIEKKMNLVSLAKFRLKRRIIV